MKYLIYAVIFIVSIMYNASAFSTEIGIYFTENEAIEINTNDLSIINRNKLVHNNKNGMIDKIIYFDKRNKLYYYLVINNSAVNIEVLDVGMNVKSQLIGDYKISDNYPMIIMPPLGNEIYVLSEDNVGSKFAVKYEYIHGSFKRAEANFPVKSQFLGYSYDGSNLYTIEVGSKVVINTFNGSTNQLISQEDITKNINIDLPWEIKKYNSESILIVSSTSKDLKSSQEVAYLYNIRTKTASKKINLMVEDIDDVLLTADNSKLLVSESEISIISNNPVVYDKNSTGNLAVYDTTKGVLLNRINVESEIVQLLGVSGLTNKAYVLATTSEAEKYKICIVDLLTYKIISEINGLEYGNHFFIIEK